MKTYSTRVRVGREHLDGGDHANWRAQLAIAEKIHFVFREQVALGLEELKTKHGLFLVMGNVSVTYRRQLRYEDQIDVEMQMWVSRLTCIEFRAVFSKDGKVVTEMSWVMPLIIIADERPTKIPSWIKDVIGFENC